NRDLLPSGEPRPAAVTPVDYTAPSTTRARTNESDEQLRFGNGYDHNWVLTKPAAQLGLAARVYEPGSGFVNARGEAQLAGGFGENPIVIVAVAEPQLLIRLVGPRAGGAGRGVIDRCDGGRPWFAARQ